MSAITMELPPVGQAVEVEVETPSGTEQLSGHLVRYDHLAGGVLFLPPTDQPKLSLRALGAQLQLSWP